MNGTEERGAGQPPRLDACDEPACAPLKDLEDSSVIVVRVDAFDAESDVRDVTLHYALNNPLDPNSFKGNEVLMSRCDPAQDPSCPQKERERFFIGTLPNPALASTEPLFFHYYFTGRDNDDPQGSLCDLTAGYQRRGIIHLSIIPRTGRVGVGTTS